jgi:hypothetical protein
MPQTINGQQFRFPSSHQSKHQRRSQTESTVHSKCALCRTECYWPSLIPGLPPLLHGCLRRTPLLHGFVLEIHNLVHRMGIRYKRRFGAFHLYIEGLFPKEATLHPQPHTRGRYCMFDIRKYGQRNPWATILDLETYRDGWLAGAEWAVGNSYKATLGNLQNSSANPDTGNSMPRSEAQQSSKHDPLNPQPGAPGSRPFFGR